MAFKLRRGRTVPYLALAILFWSGLLVVPLSHNLLLHGSSPNHSAQHSSPFCAWMCAASSAIHSADSVPERSLFVAGIRPEVEFRSISKKPFDEAPNIRPPPFILS